MSDNKRRYEEMQQKRENSAQKAHHKQKLICKTLTDEQHDILSELCGIRHELHTMNWNRAWLIDSTENRMIYDYISSENEHSINERLLKVNLPGIEWDIDLDELCEQQICEELAYSDEEMEEEYNKWLNLKEEINAKIEEYLHSIDIKHGTEYEPIGEFRALSVGVRNEQR